MKIGLIRGNWCRLSLNRRSSVDLEKPFFQLLSFVTFRPRRPRRPTRSEVAIFARHEENRAAIAPTIARDHSDRLLRRFSDALASWVSRAATAPLASVRSNRCDS